MLYNLSRDAVAARRQVLKKKLILKSATTSSLLESTESAIYEGRVKSRIVF